MVALIGVSCVAIVFSFLIHAIFSSMLVLSRVSWMEVMRNAFQMVALFYCDS